MKDIKLYTKAFLNSYSQIFFSDSKTFAIILILVSFADLYAGLYGLLAVMVTNIVGLLMGFDKRIVVKGLFGFNSLLVGLGFGIYYEPSMIMTMIIVLASIMTLFISVSLQGVIGKYGLPYLSVPFIIAAWVVTLAAREFTSLGISERGIFIINDIYTLGGSKMLSIYEWWNSLEFARPIKIYFISLGAILFQYNMLAGIFISVGLFLHSRISFTLSLLGFFTAYLFYELTGASITDLNYSYIGFNYILTSIAIGGFFIVPSWKSYLWCVILVPLVAILTISMASVFAVFSLPVFALPFNIIVLLFLYVLKFRTKPSDSLSEVVVQQNSPEKNLYAYVNDISRFKPGFLRLKLPFFGSWSVSQGHSGSITHLGDWRHAWDFVILDIKDSQFKNNGNELTDYYCYGKPIIAVADGVVELIIDNVDDNPIGVPNTRENWGNTVIIKHEEYLYSSVNHLMPGSTELKEGQKVREGDILGRCGNSGRSPYPHIHFQLQALPYIGSRTIEYPIGYFISESDSGKKLKNFSFPAEACKVSNIMENELLISALDFVPGREFAFTVSQNNIDRKESWEILTDEYNYSYIKDRDSGSKAYFENDGKMLFFRHYDGNKKDLLYSVYMALYKVPLGYYPDLNVSDKYPLNLFIRKFILFFHDFVAPFISLLKSDYTLKYLSIDSEISPGEIVLESQSVNRLFGQETRRVRTEVILDTKGLKKIMVEGKNIKIEAECDR